MVRITPEIVENAPQYTNAIRDRELDLRGYKFPAIENLGSTLDQFDTIDFSDNEIRKLDGFPLLRQLKNLIFTNNKVARISEDLGAQLPNLLTLILSSNSLSDLRDLDSLSSCSKLDFLSLLHCPVTMRANYRLYVISRVSTLRFLDYRRVTLAERKLAKSMFKRLPALSSSANNLKAPHLKYTGTTNTRSDSVKTFIPGAPLGVSAGTESLNGQRNFEMKENSEPDNRRNEHLPNNFPASNFAGTDGAMPPPTGPMAMGGKRPHGGSTQDLYAIQEAIKRSRTMEEVEHLHQLLSSGQIAGFAAQWQKQLRQQQHQKT